MKNLLKSLLFGVCLACGGHVHAAIYTLHATGIIFQGTDSQGFFGGGSLIGRSIDFTQIFDTSTSGIQNFGSASSLIGSAAFGSLSVGGVPLTALPDTNLSHTLSLTNAVTSSGPGLGREDNIFGSTQGSYSDGVTFIGFAYIQSYVNGFVPSLDFSQTLTRDLSPADSSISTIQWNKNIGGVNVGTYAYYTVHTITLNAVGAVPEPGVHAMLLAGLAALGVIARRRKSGQG